MDLKVDWFGWKYKKHLCLITLMNFIQREIEYSCFFIFVDSIFVGHLIQSIWSFIFCSKNELSRLDWIFDKVAKLSRINANTIYERINMPCTWKTWISIYSHTNNGSASCISQYKKEESVNDLVRKRNVFLLNEMEYFRLSLIYIYILHGKIYIYNKYFYLF